jgi:hypothetical protein
MVYLDPYALFRSWQIWMGTYIDAVEEALKPWTEYRWNEPEAAKSDDDPPAPAFPFGPMDIDPPTSADDDEADALDAHVAIHVVVSDGKIQLVDPENDDDDVYGDEDIDPFNDPAGALIYDAAYDAANAPVATGDAAPEPKADNEPAEDAE